MAKVTGIGGFFFKVDEPDATREWYSRHLGIPFSEWGAWGFRWRTLDDPDRIGRTEWSPFSSGTDYLDPSDKTFMLNFRVDDLDGLLAELADAGIEQVGEMESFEYGRFAWIMDPNGIKIELWEPAGEESDSAG